MLWKDALLQASGLGPKEQLGLNASMFVEAMGLYFHLVLASL
jgi:hypothetical protein